jgi:hypothetical protein
MNLNQPNDLLETWPERIYLHHGDERQVPAYTDGAGVNGWWDEPIESTDVAYVRHDRYAALEEQVRALRQAAGAGKRAAAAGPRQSPAAWCVVPAGERHKWSRIPQRGQTATCLRCGCQKCYRLNYEMVHRLAGRLEILTERPACTGGQQKAGEKPIPSHE